MYIFRAGDAWADTVSAFDVVYDMFARDASSSCHNVWWCPLHKSVSSYQLIVAVVRCRFPDLLLITGT